MIHKSLNQQFSKCAITFDGKLLDYEINNYMTLNVEGRQLLAPKLSTVEVPGRNGDLVMDSKLPAREIKVHFFIMESKNAYFLELIKRLNEILWTDEDVKFSFRDEEGYRVGRVSSIEDPPFDSNSGIGKFTIHCSDPFLYKNLKTTEDKIENLEYKKYPVKIEEIEIITGDNEKVIVTNINTGKKIILNHDFKDGDKVVIKKMR
ncbi:putative phage tail component, N-terminal domain protein [Peptoniphilus sp. oral taxon 375 str. F0436]|nr:putative phage tail component, N-terminal domain protein [Peptoniphilus sp. oral taxon 375 str. F0436]